MKNKEEIGALMSYLNIGIMKFTLKMNDYEKITNLFCNSSLCACYLNHCPDTGNRSISDKKLP